MRCKGEAWRAGGESRHEVDGIDEYILVLDVHYILIYICMYIKLSACVDQGRSMNDGLCVYLFGSLVLKANCLNNS